jgi:hypothetical protein
MSPGARQSAVDASYHASNVPSFIIVVFERPNICHLQNSHYVQPHPQSTPASININIHPSSPSLPPYLPELNDSPYPPPDNT